MGREDEIQIQTKSKSRESAKKVVFFFWVGSTELFFSESQGVRNYSLLNPYSLVQCFHCIDRNNKRIRRLPSNCVPNSCQCLDPKEPFYVPLLSNTKNTCPSKWLPLRRRKTKVRFLDNRTQRTRDKVVLFSQIDFPPSLHRLGTP